MSLTYDIQWMAKSGPFEEHQCGIFLSFVWCQAKQIPYVYHWCDVSTIPTIIVCMTKHLFMYVLLVCKHKNDM